MSGDVVQAQAAVRLFESIMYRWSEAVGLVEVPGMTPPSGQPRDAASGMDIRPSMIPVGTQRGGSAPYVWQTAPNSGGPPLVGNTKFSVTLSTTAKPRLSFLLIYSGHRRTRIIGMASMRKRRGQLVGRIPLPPLKSLCGTTLYLRSFHIDRSGIVLPPALTVALQ